MSQLRYQWKMIGFLGRLIAIQGMIFLLGNMLLLFNIPLISYLELPASLGRLVGQPWSVLTYAFVHGDLWHLFFNMLWLHFAGRLFLSLFDAARLFSVFLLGSLFAACIFLISYGLAGSSNSILVGSSAGVMAVLIFMATYTPNQRIQVLIFPIKLWHLGAVFVLIDLLQLGSGSNFGGRLAHLSGALVGYLMASQLLKGVELFEGFTQMVSRLIQVQWGGSSSIRSFKVHRSKGSGSKRNDSADSDQKKIDSILDKISAHGYDALNPEEKEYLFKKGKK